MKNLLVIIVAVSFFFLGSFFYEQKLAHINSQELLQVMPERDSAMKSMQLFAEEIRNNLEEIEVEYNNKLEAYLKLKSDSTTSLSKLKDKEEELAFLQQRYQTFQANSQNEIQAKEAELIQPILDKVNKAIKATADEKGILYVFDQGAGAIAYAGPAATDILFPVVDKLYASENERTKIKEQIKKNRIEAGIE